MKMGVVGHGLGGLGNLIEACSCEAKRFSYDREATRQPEHVLKSFALSPVSLRALDGFSTVLSCFLGDSDATESAEEEGACELRRGENVVRLPILRRRGLGRAGRERRSGIVDVEGLGRCNKQEQERRAVLRARRLHG